MDTITQYRSAIEMTLQEIQREMETQYGYLPWAKDVFSRIFPYSQKGKLMRAGLVIVGAQMKKTKISHEILVVAAIMELIHAALLIHDDIIDGDELRRGEASMHKQYINVAAQQLDTNPQIKGVGLGICVGDIMIFLVFNILAQLQTSPKQKTYMMQLVSRELITVGFGQMQDVLPESVTEEKILELYKYKTGRYSFSLPLLLGSSFRDIPFVETEMIAFGELIGQLFQITDDYLGLYGDAWVIGKPVGSDIKEGKQTLYWYMLIKEASTSDAKKLKLLIGKELQEEEINFVKQLLSDYKISEKIHVIQKRLEKEVYSVVEQMSLSSTDKKILNELIAYVSMREK